MKALFDVLAPAGEDYALARAIDPDRLPSHIAIIMDGNGRWAKRRRLPRAAGHRAGVQPVRSTVETCARLGLRALTLYAFSVENWKRPRAEVETLWRLLRRYLRAELDLMHRHNIRFTAIGRLDALPDFVREELDSVIRSTAGNKGLQLNLAINYGGRAEIVDAVAALVEDARRGNIVIDEAAISARLYTAGMPDPDLLIRTSGEMRVSNFLLWQIAYAELYVTETLWPDFSRAELLRAILDYQKRDRRFGGLTPSSLDTSLGASVGTSVNDAPREESHAVQTSEQTSKPSAELTSERTADTNAQPNRERNIAPDVDPDVESGAVETVGVPSR